MTAEKPKLLMLEAITPSTDTAFSDRLEYANLQPLVDKNLPFERQRSSECWDAEPDSLEELTVAKALATQYMMLGALALQRADTDKSQALWSERFTKASSELFGIPDTETAQVLWENQHAGVKYEIDPRLERAAEYVKDYMLTKYGSLYDRVEAGLHSSALNPIEVGNRFEHAVEILAEEHNEAWAEWTVDRNEEKDSLSVVAPQKRIIVGQRRANMPASEARGLFSHEVLVHALRSVNGASLSKGLEIGLSGYVEAEEGIGVYVEYAVSGKMQDSIVDKYIDIAYALGQIDGKQHTRAELLDHATARATARNETATVKKTPEDIKKDVFRHVNRIYRGSLGNEHVGIFTKDIVYYNGFLHMGNYIAERLEAGEPIEAVMEYIMQGKFDPTNESHTQHLAKSLAST